ncbi:transposase [Rhizobium esperanzae]|uniref:Transposase n=1 Tax=Rhizobium esperanzae TaxID=1967781 RepID=A0A7W6XZ06_9HYPH|nr:transposase [Rhizobium esperanzae]
MEKVTTIGLDIAKQVFQVHGVNGAGAIVCRRGLRRDDVVGFFKALVHE